MRQVSQLTYTVPQYYRAEPFGLSTRRVLAANFEVKVQPAAPISYTVLLSKVEEFARFGTVCGPQDILRKEQLRGLLV